MLRIFGLVCPGFYGIRPLLSKTSAHGASNNRLTTSEKLFAIPAWWQLFCHRRHLEFSAQGNALDCACLRFLFAISAQETGAGEGSGCLLILFTSLLLSFVYCKFFELVIPFDPMATLEERSGSLAWTASFDSKDKRCHLWDVVRNESGDWHKQWDNIKSKVLQIEESLEEIASQSQRAKKVKNQSFLLLVSQITVMLSDKSCLYVRMKWVLQLSNWWSATHSTEFPNFLLCAVFFIIWSDISRSGWALVRTINTLVQFKFWWPNTWKHIGCCQSTVCL